MERYSVEDLPPEWDTLAGRNRPLRRDYLQFLHRANRCSQAYYGFRDTQGRLDSIVVTFRQRINLAMFTPYSLPITATLVYVPMSASVPGMVLGARTQDEVCAFLRKLQGFVLVLNLGEESALPGFSRAFTCPRIRLPLSSSWQSLDDYLNALRSNYRRRYKLACRRGASLTFRVTESPASFDPAHYALYAQVFQRSRIRVEQLSLEYFRGCPDAAILTCELARRPVGFVQLIDNGDELIFGFIGIDYAVNSLHDVYHNLMLRMVGYGIAHGFASIDLGQTADDTKLKLGGVYEKLTAQLHHSNPLVNHVFRGVLPRLAYQPVTEAFRVFKSRGEAP